MNRVSIAGKHISSLYRDLSLLASSNIRTQYVGCLHIQNLGDTAVYEAITQLFSGRLSLYASNTPHWLVRRFQKHLPIQGILLGGGTLIKSHRYLSAIRNSKHMFPDAKFAVFGTGVEDYGFWKTSGFEIDIDNWCKTLESADFLSVRGPNARDTLTSWGLKKDIHVIGDPALYFARPNLKYKNGEKKVGLNVGPANGQLYGWNEEAVLDVGAALLKMLHGNQWNITLFPTNQKDLEYLVEAVRLSGIPFPQVNLNYLNVRHTLSEMEKQDVFIGEKLHSVVLAHCVYVPSVMLEYRPKCRDYMVSVNQQNNAFSTFDLNARAIYEKLQDIYENLEAQKTEIFLSIQRKVLSLNKAADKVIHYFSNPNDHS